MCVCHAHVSLTRSFESKRRKMNRDEQRGDGGDYFPSIGTAEPPTEIDELMGELQDTQV